MDRIVIDQYSGLAHKQLVGDAHTTRTTANRWVPTWVPERERRRLAAYVARAAYWRNRAALLLNDDTSPEDRATHREYGDVGMLVDRVVSAVLGDGWTIVVDGADDDLTAGPTLPPRPDAPGEDATDLERRVHDVQMRAWTAEAEAAVDAWERAVGEQPAARHHQTELREWAERIQLPARLTQGEQNIVALADGTYVLWPRVGDWPIVEVYDPDSYFPELPDNGDSLDFPRTVHLVWEWERSDGGEKRRYVRRLTWRLVPVTSVHVVDGPDGGLAWDGDGRPLLADNETVDAEGNVTRTMAWQTPDGEPAVAVDTCIFTDLSWDLSDVGDDANALDDSRAAIVHTLMTDMGIDYLPVVHVPNTPTGAEHYGISVIDRVAQVADDVATSDDDIMSAASYLGNPTVAVSGVKATDTELVMMPGQAFTTGEHGRMDVLDLSSGLETLTRHGDRLQDRFWQNAGVPGDIVGRVEEGDIAGITLMLRHAPFEQLVAMLRLPRGPKYALLLKMATRMAMHAGVLDSAPTPRARLQFGSFLPTDQAGVSARVAALLAAHAISTQTAVAMLVAAGFPVDDAVAEVERIHDENVTRAKAAKDLADATGSEQVAADWFGVDLPEADPLAPPVVELPEA